LGQYTKIEKVTQGLMFDLFYSDRSFMKSLLIFSVFFFSIHSFAKCYEFELIGEAEIKGDHIAYSVAKETQSEVNLKISLEDQSHFAPYINRWSKARVVLNSPELNFKTKVLKVYGVEYETPDPLNMMTLKNIKRLKEVQCPKD